MSFTLRDSLFTSGVVLVCAGLWALFGWPAVAVCAGGALIYIAVKF